LESSKHEWDWNHYLFPRFAWEFFKKLYF